MRTVEVAHLTVVRGGRDALADVSFTLAQGSLTGLLGPSGSGKTTLMRALVGVQIVASGSVQVLGLEAGSRALRHRVGYVTQDPSVYSDLTVRQNLDYFGRILGTTATDVDQVIGQVQLVDHTDSMVNRLSGGERIRVSLATALLGHPDMLVLDEPTVGLDPVLRRDLWNLFRQLADRGTTLLVSSHVMDEATRCDRLLILREGRLLADATLAELRARTGLTDPDEIFLSLIDEAQTAA